MTSNNYVRQFRCELPATPHTGFPLFSPVAAHPTVSAEKPPDRAAVFTRNVVCEAEVNTTSVGVCELVQCANLRLARLSRSQLAQIGVPFPVTDLLDAVEIREVAVD